MAQEQLLQGGRLTDQAAHTGVAEHLDEFSQAFAVDLGAHCGALDADVLDSLDSAEVSWITDHFGLDRGAAEVPQGV
ncbi:Uncharacterised protein [Mycobacterium tuberculosis]|nr:Uncharacterised protein [Mycobacterium tuberculosis]